LRNLPALIPVKFKDVENEFYHAQFTRNPADDHIIGHITYHKYSSTAKKMTVEMLQGFKEPVYSCMHNIKMWKYQQLLGFTSTGRTLNVAFPGYSKDVFPEVVYYPHGFEQYSLQVYEEAGEMFLPTELVDGYGVVADLEKRMKEVENVTWTTTHHFSDGVYTRSTFIPSGTLFIGYRHRNSTVTILSTGVLSLISTYENGQTKNHGVLHAPQVLVTEVLVKKVGFAHEDTIMLNSFSLQGLPEEFHNEASIDVVEDFIFCDGSKLCLE